MDEAATGCGGGGHFANRAFLLAKACRQLKWYGRSVVGVSDKSV